MANESGKNRVGALLDEHREEIARNWIRFVKERSRSHSTIAEMEQELTPIFNAIVAGAREGKLNADDAAYDELRALLSEYSRTRARQGFSPSETAAAIFALRDAVLASAHDEKVFAELPPFSRFIDDLGLVTFEAFTRTRETVIASQTEQLLELSTPVIKLWDGILAVPLVGTLDSARTQVVMEALLQALVTTGSAHAIIDITGVPAVDTEVAQHLLKTVFAARLMGAECVISGIRPQIAQTIVGLGIEFGDIPTKASLADALRVTLNRAGLEIRKIPQRP
jgi:rsbT co-antagonist protein RsbR